MADLFDWSKASSAMPNINQLLLDAYRSPRGQKKTRSE